MATLSELKSDVRWLTRTDSSSYGDTDLERNINFWYRKIAAWIWEATGTWQYDDTNKTTLPIATTNLGQDRDNYSMPIDAQKLMKVEVKNNSGDWTSLDPIDVSEIDTPSEFFEDPGMPQYYDVMANVVVLYPAPDSDDVILSGGLKLHVSREIDKLSSSSDTPGFEKQFHRILSYGAALDWCIARSDEKKEVDIRRQIEGDTQTDGTKEELREYYARRNQNRKSGFEVKQPNMK